VIQRPTAILDERDVRRVVSELLARRLGYTPEWRVDEETSDAAIAQIFARYIYAVIQRLNQAPEKNKLAFLDQLGVSPATAQAARAPIVFQMSPDSPDSRAPAGTQVAAPPPPGARDQIIFETERAVGLSPARLKEVFSLWPGRDQYINHSAALLAGDEFQLFSRPLLADTPHELFIAHDKLLALAGGARVEVEFELTQASGEELTVLWEYWEGNVWRGFKSANPACSAKEAEQADSTRGFTSSGRFLLESDCADSKKRIVNGVDAFWIRAQLKEPLLPDQLKFLPLVESVRLSTLIDRTLKARLAAVITNEDQAKDLSGTVIQGALINEAGQPMSGVAVKITDPGDPNFVQTTFTTDQKGKYNQSTPPTPVAASDQYEFRASFFNQEAKARLNDLVPGHKLEANLTFSVEGLDPDLAFAGGEKLDVTKPFFPLGQAPQPGAAFYFSQEEVFSKPGAKAQIYVAKTFSPQDEVDINPGTKSALDHLIAWEYWNGSRWFTMFYSTSAPNTSNSKLKTFTKDLGVTEIIEFTVPEDIEKTKINEQEALWMRARLVSGGYGFKAEVPTQAGGTTGAQQNVFTFVINQPPSVAAFRIGYSWRYGPFHPEHVVAYNDFQYEDRTFEATWPGAAFPPFTRMRDITPAMYLGFDKKLPVDQIGVYFDIAEERGETRGPAMLWEYFDGAGWRELSFQDETRNLRVPGVLSFIAAEDSKLYARFGTPLHWVRGRLKEDGPPGEPLIKGVFPNAVWGSEQRTFTDTPLGASSGLSNQVFRFTQIPVLAGERVEAQELSGKRANVEWRIVAREVEKDDPNVIRDLEEILSREGNQTDIIKGDIRLRRNRDKKVAEVWVRWEEREHFFSSGAGDRHYVIDRARGLLFFGDGTRGKIPPPGAAILARLHRAGGGLAGNVAARAIKQLLGPISGVQAVFNPTPAEGGADGEPLEKFGLRGPKTIRHRGRAVAPSDYETMAYEASPAVAVARAIPLANPNGPSGRSLRGAPGWVTLIIIPQSSERRPLPSFGLREKVRKFIEARAAADIVACGQIHVTGPVYQPIDVRATIAPKDPSEAGEIERRARQALEEFLHPLRGGPERSGWAPGRDIYLSDVASALERVEGLDYVEELALLLNGGVQGERAQVAEDRIAVAGEIRLKLKGAEV
jgi:baseplate J-like protein